MTSSTLHAAFRLTLLFAVIFLLSRQVDAQVTGVGYYSDNSSPSSVATGVSDDGLTVVGNSDYLDTGGINAFRWNATDGIQALRPPNGSTTDLNIGGVSGDGQIIVGNDRANSDTEAFRWTEETGVVGMGFLSGATSSFADDISVDGSTIVGSSGLQASRWTEGSGLEGLGQLTPGGRSGSVAVSGDGAVVVGDASTDAGTAAFRWTEETGMVNIGLVGDTLRGTGVTDVSADGTTIIGEREGVSGGIRSFKWTSESGMVALETIFDASLDVTRANAVSGDGSVIGGFGFDEDGSSGAMLWIDDDSPVMLYDLLESQGQDLSQWQSLFIIHGISSDGSLVTGQGINADGLSEGFVARISGSSVPEPGSAAVLALFAVVGLIRRRRDK